MSWENYTWIDPIDAAANAADAQRRAAHTAANRMSREDFLRKYGTTFVADDRGGNAASEVAGQDVGAYYDQYLADGATGDLVARHWDSEIPEGTRAMPTFGWKYRDANPYFDAWDNVDPHPTSQDLGGVGEFWRQVGRPVATAAATYFGVNALGGLMGGAGSGAGFSGIGGTGGSAGIGSGTALGGAELAGAAGAGDVAALSGSQIAALNPVATGTGFTGSMAMPELAGSMPAGVTEFSSMIPATPAAGTGYLTSAGMAGGAGSAAGAGLLGGATDATGALIGAGTAPEGAAAMAAAQPSFLSRVGSALTDPSNLVSLLGAVGGAAASRDSTTSATTNRDPWGPAQPYLLDNLATNAAAQEHYRARPFSDLQQQQYQGLFNSLANSQANVPGLLANASSFGQSSRGRMPAMRGLLSGTQAPAIDWNQYANIGRRG